MRYALVGLVTLCLAGSKPLEAGQPVDAPSLVLSRVTVIDATGSAPRPDMTVVIDKGRIAVLGKSDTVVVPPRAAW